MDPVTLFLSPAILTILLAVMYFAIMSILKETGAPEDSSDEDSSDSSPESSSADECEVKAREERASVREKKRDVTKWDASRIIVEGRTNSAKLTVRMVVAVACIAIFCHLLQPAYCVEHYRVSTGSVEMEVTTETLSPLKSKPEADGYTTKEHGEIDGIQMVNFDDGTETSSSFYNKTSLDRLPNASSLLLNKLVSCSKKKEFQHTKPVVGHNIELEQKEDDVNTPREVNSHSDENRNSSLHKKQNAAERPHSRARALNMKYYHYRIISFIIISSVFLSVFISTASIYSKST